MSFVFSISRSDQTSKFGDKTRIETTKNRCGSQYDIGDVRMFVIKVRKRQSPKEFG